MNQIGIIRLSALGDIIHTIPAVALLARNFPQAKIVWFVAPAGARLLSLFENIEQIVEIDLKRSFIQSLTAVRELKNEWRGRLDLLIDFQGLFKSALLARILTKNTLGFARSAIREKGAEIFYKTRVVPSAQAVHIIDKNIELLRPLNIDKPEYLFPLKKIAPSEKLSLFLEKKFAGQAPVVLNTGGGWQTKRLSAEQLAELIGLLHKRIPLLLLWGNEEERRVAENLAATYKLPVSEFLDFSDLICLLQKSRLIITADTLVMHLADMLQIPVAGIFGPTDFRRNGPKFTRNIIFFNHLPCSFCYLRKCATIECMKSLAIQQMAQAVEKFYNELN